MMQDRSHEEHKDEQDEGQRREICDVRSGAKDVRRWV